MDFADQRHVFVVDALVTAPFQTTGFLDSDWPSSRTIESIM